MQVLIASTGLSSQESPLISLPYPAACRILVASTVGSSPRPPYMSGMIPLPELLERCWLDASPGRESAARNELLRSVLALIEPRHESKSVVWVRQLAPWANHSGTRARPVRRYGPPTGRSRSSAQHSIRLERALASGRETRAGMLGRFKL